MITYVSHIHKLVINAAFVMLPYMSHTQKLLINAAFIMLPVDASHVDETHSNVCCSVYAMTLL